MNKLEILSMELVRCRDYEVEYEIKKIEPYMNLFKVTFYYLGDELLELEWDFRYETTSEILKKVRETINELEYVEDELF